MGNRVLKAKSLKLNRQIRQAPRTVDYNVPGKFTEHRSSVPRRFAATFVSAPRTPNEILIAQYKESARGLAFDDTYLNWLEATARFKNKPPGRVEAEATWARIREASPKFTSVTLEVNLNRCVKMYYNVTRTEFILYEENYTGRFVRASIRYQDRKRCIDRFKSSQVRWVEFVSSSPAEP